MNRNERRRRERAAKRYDQRQTFTKTELEEANEIAYALGVDKALEAAAKVLGLGPTRIERVRNQLARIEYETFIKPFEGEGQK